MQECAERANIPELEELFGAKGTVKFSGLARKAAKGAQANYFATQVSEPRTN